MTTRDRFRGLMLGTAVGDALGRPVEGHQEVSQSYIDEILAGPRSMIYTDDTAMTIWLAESLLAAGRFDGADMSMRFAEGYQREPRRGYGANVIDVFSRVLRGFNWAETAHSQFGGTGSYGNGAAMRVAPVALWEFPDIDATVRLAEQTAEVTHTHPVGVEGAAIQATAAGHALRDDFDRDELLGALDDLVKEEIFRSKLEILPTAIERSDDGYARLRLGNGVSAGKSVLTALYCFLASDDFEDTVVRAIRIGGDTDTIAAMAGALAGARYGATTIPEVWTGVEGGERLVELADAMFERVG
ncbi:MAG: ADP-ribosylglycohydrolase family protein [Acidimicrobiia bacterium]